MSANGDQERQRRVRLATGPLSVGAVGIEEKVAMSLLGGGDFAAGMTLAGALLLLAYALFGEQVSRRTIPTPAVKAASARN